MSTRIEAARDHHDPAKQAASASAQRRKTSKPTPLPREPAEKRETSAHGPTAMRTTSSSKTKRTAAKRTTSAHGPTAKREGGKTKRTATKRTASAHGPTVKRDGSSAKRTAGKRSASAHGPVANRRTAAHAKNAKRASSPQRTPAKRENPAGTGTRYWSHHVMETSDALDLEPGVFRQPDPVRIAQSLRRSAEQSQRRKAEPFRSAMSMLIFYINRAGKNLPAPTRRTLEQAKDELRKLYGRPAHRG